jgi:hypothetical protein
VSTRLAFVGLIAIAACGVDHRLSDAERLAIAEEVAAATRAFEAVQRALDAEGAVALLAPEYHMYVDGRHMAYAAVAAGIRDGFAAARQVTPNFQDLRVLVQGPDAAIASFTFRDSIVTHDGALIRSRGATTLAWERREGRWVMVYGHADHYPPE